MEATPALVVGGHGRSEAAFQEGLEHGVVTGSFSGESATEGHGKVTIGLIEPLSGLRPDLGVEAHGHNRVGHPVERCKILRILTQKSLFSDS